MDELRINKQNHIAQLTLNRADKRNALNASLIHALAKGLKDVAHDDAIRVVIIKGEGEHFCAGGDIKAMAAIARGDDSEANHHDAQQLADLMYQLYVLPKPTIVLAQGAILGGGLGLLTAADIALAASSATFGFPEVGLGITPSVISPYVISAIGQRAARYYFLTGQRFDAETAHRLGLVHQVVAEELLLSQGLQLAEQILRNGPEAIKVAKQLIRFVEVETITAGLAHKTAEHLADLRATPEAQEGMQAFLEKRQPKWRDDVIS